MTDRSQEEQASIPSLERLGALARGAWREGAPPQPGARARLLEAAHDSIHQHGPRRALLVVGALAAVVVAAGSLFFASSEDRPIHYTTVEPSSGGDERWLRFSDESLIALAMDTEAQVTNLRRDGATVRVDRGRARVDISHTARRRNWLVLAGPYRIQVVGTTFDVQWSSEEHALHLTLTRGSVVVEGPMASNGVRVSAGQSLRARPREGLLTVGPSQAPTLVEAPPTVTAPLMNPRAPAAKPMSKSTGGKLAAETSNVPRDVERWSHWVSSGAFARVLESADGQARGTCLTSCAESALVALADAARYGGNPALAQQALLAQRRRFPREAGAPRAAFLLGRLAEEVRRSPTEAVTWYERYLEEAPGGPLASDALGRKMLLLRGTGGREARDVAREYLRRFPAGAYARAAQEIALSR